MTASFMPVNHDLRNAEATTMGGFTGERWICQSCRKPWGLEVGRDRCEHCGHLVMEQVAQPELWAQVGGGIRKITSLVLPKPPEPQPTAEALEPLRALQAACEAVSRALPPADAVLRRLVVQGGPVDRWGWVQGIVATVAGSAGDYRAGSARIYQLAAALRRSVGESLDSWWQRPAWELGPEPTDSDLAALGTLVQALDGLLVALPAADASLRSLVNLGEENGWRFGGLQAAIAEEATTAGDFSLVAGGFFPLLPACRIYTRLLEEAIR